MLVNRTYLGYVKYQQYAKHPDGSRSMENPLEWFAGKHQPIINEDLFEQCQEVRASRRSTNQYHEKYRVYLLRNLLYCVQCVEEMPDSVDEANYGKMRPQCQKNDHPYYRCRARDYGMTASHPSISADIVETQVIDILKAFDPPVEWHEQMVNAMSKMIGDRNVDHRIEEIKAIIERMDFRWDHGFVSDYDRYLGKRQKLQQELEQLKPIPTDELERAAEIIADFSTHWDKLGDDRKKQAELIQLIVRRVWVADNQVVGISLRPDFYIPIYATV